MNSFFSRLESRARALDSLLCVGLDPHPADLPELSGAAARQFCLRLIEATADVTLAYKPNAAFFEALGSQGIAVLGEVIAAVPAGIPVILDAKRGDIASTAEAYARAAFETLGADAITLNPYLGRDSLEPFIANPDKGVFVLCKTSNPGAADLQDLTVQHPASSVPCMLYEHVARLAAEWNTRNNLGLVVGATQLEALGRARAAAPGLWFLAPGVGTQGGDLRGALRAGLRADGLGMLIPVSRGIARASDPRQAALDLRAAINQERRALGGQPAAPGVVASAAMQASAALRSVIAAGLLEAGCVQFGAFTLKSGQVSPIYIDLRRLVGHPRLLAQVAEAYVLILKNLAFDRLAALPYAALPIATAISLRGGWPLVYPRKEAKAYGTKAEIEGVFEAGEQVVVIDDLITTGGSKFEGIEKLTAARLRVRDVVVLIDRSADGGAELARRGFTLHAVATIGELLTIWEHSGSVAAEQIAAARAFLRLQ
jgi:uridine monophosphate synthetase